MKYFVVFDQNNAPIIRVEDTCFSREVDYGSSDSGYEILPSVVSI